MRKLCWWAVPCSAAVFLSVYLFPEPFLLPAGVLCALGSLVSLLFHGNTRRKTAFAAFGLAAGFLWTGCYGLLVRAPARALIGETAQDYTLVVTDFPKANSRGASLSAKLQTDGLPGARVQLYAGEDALEFRPGDVISGPVRLAASDFLRGESVDYYQAKGTYLLGYAQDDLTLTERPTNVPLRYFPQYTAHALIASVGRVFSQDVSGFMTALLTGDKSALPTGLYAAFQRSGISHIIAVSGLHIGFLAGLLAVLLGRRSRLSAIMGICLMFFFAAVAGNTPSAIRAAFMSSLLLLAPLLGREPDKPTTLSAALLVLLLPCPYAAASISLQLSFAAVAGIYLVTEDLLSRWLKAIPKWDGLWGKLARKILVFLASNLAVTIGALLFSAPLSALHFGSVSLVGPLTNLLTLWAVSAAFLGGLISALLGLVSVPLGSVAAWFTAWPARWILLVAQGVSRLPYAAISLLSGHLIFYFIVAYAVLLLWLAGRKKMRPVFPLSALCVILCAALAISLWPARTGDLTVAVLDVGQGSATLFYSKGHSVLVDCGGNGGDDPGDISADYLQSLGTSHLDALILTHFHSDHACGVPELLSRIDVSLLILPDISPEAPLRQEILNLSEELNCEVKFLVDDSTFTFGPVEYTLFAPLGDGGANEEGLSVLCTVDDFDVLVTGDMNDIIERRLVKYKSLPDIELLVVGHHGSKNSTSEELLLATTPEAAVISSGYNSYGHPAPETLERLGAAGCDIYLTKDMGTVTFTVKGE